MIYVTQSYINQVTLVLKDIETASATPSYTWKLTNSQNQEETIFYTDNNSNGPFYASFTVSVFTYSGLTAGIINIRPGQYDVEIYEMSQPYILDLSQALRKVKDDIMICVGTVSYAMPSSGVIPKVVPKIIYVR